MAPSLRNTEAEAKSGQQRQRGTSQMNALRSNEARPADIQPPSIVSARTSGPNHQTSTAPRQPENLDHPQALPVDVVNPAAHAAAAPHDRQRQESTAQAQQRENRANVPWWSRLMSPVWMIIRAMPMQCPPVDNQVQQHTSLHPALLSQAQNNTDMLAQMKTLAAQQVQILEQLKQLKRVQIQVKNGEVKREENKPKKKLTEYHFYVKEEHKKLAGAPMSFGEKAAAIGKSWQQMSKEERTRRCGDLVIKDKERFEREMEGWWEEHNVPVDERKPAAKPTPDERAVSQESVTDAPIESQPPSEEPVAATAACPPARPGPGAPDEGDHHLSEYEQYRRNKIARNEERLRSLGLDGAGAEGNGGFLYRSAASKKKERRKKRKNDSADPLARRSPRLLSHDLLGNGVQCPVGHKFIRSVPPSCYNDGYECESEVVKVDGDWRYCKYDDGNGKERIAKLLLRTIQEA